MSIRIRLLSLAVLAFPVAVPARAADLDGSPPAVGAAEAVRLYDRANDFVTRIHEGDYSYVYLQFYWKRAESNVDRVLHVYADSPMARTLASGSLKLGPYPLDYFRDRVLYRLEQKRLGALDSVNCQIFLYGLDERRDDAGRNAALESILEVLARQQRWGEVLAFPVLDRHRALLLGTIFRVAARYDQKAIVDRLLASVLPGQQQAAHFWPELAEADALLGKPRAQLDALIKAHPGDDVRRAALNGYVLREITIRRMQTLRASIKATIATTHFEVLNLTQRDDVVAAAARLFPGRPALAAPALAIYRASQGEVPARSAAVEAQVAYLRYLADAGRFDELDAAVATASASLAPASQRRLQEAAIEFYAEAGRTEDAERGRLALAAQGPAAADAAGLAEFRGEAESIGTQLTVREKTFADLPIRDACVLAQAIGEWSLSPNRTQRGAFPWDAVVYKVSPGFDHLPPPASIAVKDAASTLKPY
jgi:hypothetical protein